MKYMVASMPVPALVPTPPSFSRMVTNSLFTTYWSACFCSASIRAFSSASRWVSGPVTFRFSARIWRKTVSISSSTFFSAA